MNRGIVYLGIAVMLSTLLVSPVAGANAMASEPTTADEPMLHVELSSNGDATVSLVSVYDLTDEDERDAFETLEADDEARTELLNRFTDRMQSTAANANNDLDREMAVTADAVDVRTTDDHGVVVLSVEWQQFAAVEDDQLIVTEPFASGYEADRPLVIAGPDDSAVDTAAPEPDTETDQEARWDTETNFDGFEATFSLTAADGTDDTEDDSVPGFGVAMTGVALLAVIGGILRHGR